MCHTVTVKHFIIRGEHMDTPEALIRCGHDLVSKGLTWGNSGNISIRTEPDTFMMTASGTNLGSLQSKDIIKCEITQDAHYGTRAPSMETGLHRAVYQACKEAGAIIHSQPVFSTIVACSDIPIRTDFLPESMAYLKNIIRVPYHHAGSRDLAQATANQSPNSQVLLLDNHGVVCWGSTIDEAFLITQTLEFCCHLMIISRMGQLELNYLGDEVVQDFRCHLANMSKRD